ncbi:leucine-rich repeat-containing protein 15 [Anabrus simplex]|uniref:leucine-rich repeat-containing protein 15 n=1 Tax=Anabrus simplex TaxID=316456 RepID=UPI0035A37049
MSVLLLVILGVVAAGRGEWRCPEITRPPAVACSCDLPHTLRCTGDRTALRVISEALRGLPAPAAVSLLDCTVQGVGALTEPLLEGVALHGLVVSSGEIRHVAQHAFSQLAGPLQALGLPNNQLEAVPTSALQSLPALDRLDLSHNRLHSLDASSFKGLSNLTFLELSENHLTQLAPDTFLELPELQTLRLRGNRLGIGTVSALKGLRILRDLDLSDNLLVGPLGPSTVPPLRALHTLQMSHNQFSSVRRGALKDFYALNSLTLHHNHIDVLEDHAFRELRNLMQLNLAHNRIVAVSGASLAHLEQLTQLDLAHNFLRALTADLIAPLHSLKELRLDDNDISMVTSDALTPNVKLHRLTLADNPLNCDCSLSEFASWLSNSSQIPASDRESAVCVTPPSLENGHLVEVPPGDLQCGEEETIDLAPPEEPLEVEMPGSDAKATLHTFQYDGSKITLTWNVEASAIPYACNSLIVYEEMGMHEVLLESIPLNCNSSQLEEPRILITPLTRLALQQGNNYRYCVLLLEGGGSESDELMLDWGCSDIIPLMPTSHPQTQPQPLPTGVHIADLHVNITAPGTIAIAVQVRDQLLMHSHCILTVTVYASDSLTAKEHLNCSHPKTTLRGLPKSPYRVCATIGDIPMTSPRARCTTVEKFTNSNVLGGLSIAIAVAFVALSSFVVGLCIVSRRIFRRPKQLPTHQCFLAGPQDEHQHSRYVKLQATTRL